jgi:transposase InsO family protein
MIAFIDDHREAHGVEPICKVLPIAPSTYHDHVAKRIDPSRLSARAKRDEALKNEVRRVFEANFRVYGVRKVWRQLQREGFDVARCTVARLMKAMGLEGIIRGKPIRLTRRPGSAPIVMCLRSSAMRVEFCLRGFTCRTFISATGRPRMPGTRSLSWKPCARTLQT